MKKLLSIILCLVLAFGVLPVNTFALGTDVDLNMGEGDSDDPTPPTDPEQPTAASIRLEAGKDDGYFIDNGNNSFTAVAYDGNEFLGWFKDGSDVATSTATTATLNGGSYIAKFKNNNVLAAPNGGYELGTINENLIGSSWQYNPSKGNWRSVKTTNNYAKSGTKSLMFNTRFQHDIYADIKGLEKDTYYVVSYYWMLPKSVITDTSTASDGYYGSVIGSANSTTENEAYKEALGGDYTGAKNISFVGGQWNKVEYVFYSENGNDLKLFFSYESGQNTGNDYLYVDELMVYKAPDQQAVAKYKATVSAENGYAYSTETQPVPYNTEVTVVATPFGGYVFDGWYENGVKVSTDKIYTFNIEYNRNLVAKCVLATEDEKEYTPDMNNDSAVDLQDVVLLAQYVAGWEVEINKAAIDVNGDGNVDLNDVVLLAQKVAGWDVDDQLAGSASGGNVLPDEDLTEATLKATLTSGNSEYYNKSTIINEGNKSLIAGVFKKAQSGQDITIVGFGGSITQGAGATNVVNRYGERVAAWFQSQFPNINVSYINSGIGSTTSLVGVHRMKEHVFDHNPDLVLVDFTTNDSAGDVRYRLSYETILRTLLKKEIAVISVLFGSVNNYSAENSAGSNTRVSTSLSSHLPSMLYYDVPVIDYYGSLWRYLDAGVIKWTDVGNDYVHPKDAGHLIAASAINYYLSTVLSDLDSVNTVPPAIPEEYLFGDDIYETATFLGSDDITPVSNTNFTGGSVHGTKLEKGWICNSSEGGSITFEIKGVTNVYLLLQYKSGNASGSIILNGKTVVNNAKCDNSSTSGYVWIAYLERFDEPTDITITVKCDGKFGFAPIGVCFEK